MKNFLFIFLFSILFIPKVVMSCHDESYSTNGVTLNFEVCGLPYFIPHISTNNDTSVFIGLKIKSVKCNTHSYYPDYPPLPQSNKWINSDVFGSYGFFECNSIYWYKPCPVDYLFFNYSSYDVIVKYSGSILCTGCGYKNFEHTLKRDIKQFLIEAYNILYPPK